MKTDSEVFYLGNAGGLQEALAYGPPPMNNNNNNSNNTVDTAVIPSSSQKNAYRVIATTRGTNDDE